jgi:hypothetical protein
MVKCGDKPRYPDTHEYVNCRTPIDMSYTSVGSVLNPCDNPGRESVREGGTPGDEGYR